MEEEVAKEEPKETTILTKREVQEDISPVPYAAKSVRNRTGAGRTLSSYSAPSAEEKILSNFSQPTMGWRSSASGRVRRKMREHI